MIIFWYIKPFFSTYTLFLPNSSLHNKLFYIQFFAVVHAGWKIPLIIKHSSTTGKASIGHCCQPLSFSHGKIPHQTQHPSLLSPDAASESSTCCPKKRSPLNHKAGSEIRPSETPVLNNTFLKAAWYSPCMCTVLYHSPLVRHSNDTKMHVFIIMVLG